jgi:hypothetical protein
LVRGTGLILRVGSTPGGSSWNDGIMTHHHGAMKRN